MPHLVPRPSYPHQHPHQPQKLDCPFCEIVQDPSQAHIILSTPTLLVFLDRMPLTRGHILCIPRLHYPHLPTFPSHISAKLGEILPSLTHALTQVTGVDDFNVILNNGERAGQTVQHVHWHIIPRPGDGKWNMFARGPRTQDLDDDEAAVLAFEVREELGRGLWKTREATQFGNGGGGGGGVGGLGGNDGRRMQGGQGPSPFARPGMNGGVGKNPGHGFPTGHGFNGPKAPGGLGGFRGQNDMGPMRIKL